MILVRSVRPSDIDQLWQLIAKATYGLTTLQVSKKQLSDRLELSHFAFERETDKPAGEPYVFVMEERRHGKLIGVSSIFSKVGGFEPFYSYRRVNEAHYCKLLDRTQNVETLQLYKDHDGPTEIGSLYLDDAYRGQGRGRLLSLIRFAFMAVHRKRFADEVIVELRGAMTDEGVSPFWEGLGRHFFEMDFPQADMLSTLSKRFIEDWFPKHPIYLNLLPESAKMVIGCVHQNSAPAMSMLMGEGFQQTDLIDIFDGGPTLSCWTDQILAVQRTRQLKVGRIDDSFVARWEASERADPPLTIIAVPEREYRGMLAAVEIDDDSGDLPSATISPLTAATLDIQIGQTISVTALHP